MTTPAKDGNIYLWLMGGQITLILAFMAMVWNYSSSMNEYIRLNSVEHQQIYQSMMKDSTWTRWVFRNQIVPAYELSFENDIRLKDINTHLVSIDSNIRVSNSNIKRIFFFLRKERDGVNAMSD